MSETGEYGRAGGSGRWLTTAEIAKGLAVAQANVQEIRRELERLTRELMRNEGRIDELSAQHHESARKTSEALTLASRAEVAADRALARTETQPIRVDTGAQRSVGDLSSEEARARIELWRRLTLVAGGLVALMAAITTWLATR